MSEVRVKLPIEYTVRLEGHYKCCMLHPVLFVVSTCYCCRVKKL